MTDLLVMDVTAARRLTERIRLIAQNVSDNIAKLRELVEEARTSEAHIALGYVSWPAYLSEVFGDEPLRLERDVRQELVAELAAQGMSTRAIAPIVGVSQRTVADDVSSSAQVTVNATTGEIVETTREVVGLDGKSYTAPDRRAVKPSAEANLLNDIRLYLRTLARSPQIARLSDAGKQHLITALQDTITKLEGN